MLTNEQILNFKKNGYLVLPNFAEKSFCENVIQLAKYDLEHHVAPVEYEADTQYPGAPASRLVEGGMTARRILNAFERYDDVAEWATSSALRTILHPLLGKHIYLSQVHHNCIITKQPKFSGTTGWHRDNHYWNFEYPDLVSTWLALTDEDLGNGCLWVVPASHRWEIEDYQYNEQKFLRLDSAKNRDLLGRSISISLQQGDLLLFHSNLFHGSGRNTTDNSNLSLVFTYHAGNNPPRPGSRSASKPEVLIASADTDDN